MRVCRGFRYWVIRLIADPLPAASRPSKISQADPLALLNDPLLHGHQLLLEPFEFTLVSGLLQLGRSRAILCAVFLRYELSLQRI